MSDIVPVPRVTQPAISDSLSSAIERLKTADVTEAKAIRDDAATVHDLLRTRNAALSELNEIALLKITAERRIGSERARVVRGRGAGSTVRFFDWSVAKQLMESGLDEQTIASRLNVTPGAVRYAKKKGWTRSEKTWIKSAVRLFDDALNVSTPLAASWERLARMPDEKFADAVRHIAEAGDEVTTKKVLIRAQIFVKGPLERVETGIFRQRDGRFLIRYSVKGRMKHETLRTRNLKTARHIRLVRKGIIKEHRAKPVGDLASAYGDLRILLQLIDRLQIRAAPGVRKALDEALVSGANMEDHLMVALNEARTR